MCVYLCLCFFRLPDPVPLIVGAEDAADAGGDAHQEHGPSAKHGLPISGNNPFLMVVEGAH